ncbi:hypothetical protein GCM10009784_14420 [Arthrobacter parietis]|uniref:Secreted protein n=1 Tax=Arthrobacter parietis TaxID=271434 RepID=A0ABN3AUL9_9MICC
MGLMLMASMAVPTASGSDGRLGVGFCESVGMLLSVAVGDEDGPADSVLGVVGGAAVSSVAG